MLKILRNRFIGLGRDEDGAALVITLAVFMFIYVLFIGIWAVGTNVRTRIHLQNACDAAAYSAAVVQADTLSRIATLNRAMSWTYVQMTRRQMDYIMYRWLDEACNHHLADSVVAAAYALKNNHCTHGGKCPLCILPPLGWRNKDITLHCGKSEYGPYSESNLRNIVSKKFPADMQKRSAQSFYAASASLSGLKRQIKEDLGAIDEMNEAERMLLTGGDGVPSLPERIEAAAQSVWQENLPQELRDRCPPPRVFQSENPLAECFTTLRNTDSGEKRLVGFSDAAYRRHFALGGQLKDPLVFDRGADTWFVRSLPLHEGIRRVYAGNLHATWSWFATGWTCGIIHGIHWMIPTSYAEPSICVHGLHDPFKCHCQKSGSTTSGSHNTNEQIFGRFGKFLGLKSRNSIIAHWNDAICYADNNFSSDERYYSRKGIRPVYANPLLLKKAYFGKSGSIVVGASCRNANPWASLVGDTSRGLFSAFNPFCADTVVFASAKAGYRDFSAGASFGRDYHIDWANEADWNLYTSDWDAVLTPAAKAATLATGGAWNSMVAFLDGYVGELTRVAEFLSGGNWQIGNRGHDVDWDGVQRRMWH